MVCRLLERLGKCGLMVGLDGSVETLARREEGTPFIPVAADALSLPLPTGSFGMVSMTNSLHHMDCPHSAVAEMARVLEPGGWLLLGEMHGDSPGPPQVTHIEMHAWWAAIDRRLGRSHYGIYDRESIRGFARAADLEDPVEWEEGPDADSDPFDASARSRLEEALERYAKTAEGLPDAAGLLSRVPELRSMLASTGVLRPRMLFLLGRRQA